MKEKSQVDDYHEEVDLIRTFLFQATFHTKCTKLTTWWVLPMLFRWSNYSQTVFFSIGLLPPPLNNVSYCKDELSREIQKHMAGDPILD